MPKDPSVSLELDGHEVTVTNPNKVYFPEAGISKLELVEYFMAVADGALLGVRDRPMALKRFVDGITGEAFFQKRAPKSVPDYVSTVELAFPSGRTADEVVVSNRAALAWVANLGCVDLNPHPVRADDLDHPDELRADLDPGPGVPWADVRRVALVVRDVLADHGLTGWPKTSGSRGIHVYTRIERRWGFPEVRRAALAMAREVERRAPDISTSKWWKEERHGVFIDYNQNAKDRTVASAYSVRPVPGAWVSAPLTWDEVPDAELGDFTLRTMPARYAKLGDVGAGHWRHCWSCRSATRRPALATRRGRRTTSSSRASRPASSRHGAACPGRRVPPPADAPATSRRTCHRRRSDGRMALFPLPDAVARPSR
jgi:DNA ligase D-like protein (predicted polymerase)